MAIPTFAKAGKTYLEIVGLDGDPIDYVPDNMLFEVDDFDLGTKEALIDFVRKCEYWQCKLPKVVLDAAVDLNKTLDVYCYLLEEFGEPNFSTQSIKLVLNDEIITDEDFIYCLEYNFTTKQYSSSQRMSLMCEYVCHDLALFLSLMKKFNVLPSGICDIDCNCRECEGEFSDGTFCVRDNVLVKICFNRVENTGCLEYLHECGFDFGSSWNYSNSICSDFVEKIEESKKIKYSDEPKAKAKAIRTTTRAAEDIS